MATTWGGLPYPVGTDFVADGDNAIHALALAQEEFNKTIYSPIVGANALTGADVAVVGMSLGVGVWDVTALATMEWSITGTARYYFSIYAGPTLVKSWQSYIPGTGGTVVTVGRIPNLALAALTYVQVMARQQGVTGGQANVASCQMTARRTLGVAA